MQLHILFGKFKQGISKKIETNRDYVGINNIVHEKNIFWYYGLCTVEKLKIEYKTSNHWIDV